MTPMERLIHAEIAVHGPISMARYMELALSHPEHGYYTTRDPFGVAGDFITAPEISQMFGELIGLWIAQCWQDQGSPNDIVLAELGPGRGTLMSDALRSLKLVPGFLDEAEIWMVETSPVLRKACEATLPNHQIKWATGIEELPDKPLFLMANEFFDALPVRQFQKVDVQWFERMVGADEHGLNVRLTPMRGDLPFAVHPAMADGAIVEYSPLSVTIAQNIHQRIVAKGGTALIVDYGSWDGVGDTIQALRSHATANIFDAPGQADLTAHVNFERLCDETTAQYFTTQGEFLEHLGVTARANQLAAGADQKAAQAVQAAHRRLTHPDEMGKLFKVLGLMPKDAPQPVGFAL